MRVAWGLASVLPLLLLASCGNDNKKPDEGQAPPAGVAHLDNACSEARCQSLLMLDTVTVGLHGGDQPRTLKVTARPNEGRVDLTLELFEGGSHTGMAGPYGVPDGGFSSLSMFWGGVVTARVTAVENGLVRLLVTEEENSAP